MVPSLPSVPDDSGSPVRDPAEPFSAELLLAPARSELGPGTRTAVVLAAVGLHGLLFLLTFPASGPPRLPAEPSRPSLTIQPWNPAPPPPRPDSPVQVRDAAHPIPIPDATPHEPEPPALSREEPVRAELAVDFAPPSLPTDIPAAPSRPATPLVPDGVNVTHPRLIPATKVLPEYPELARRVGAEGRVILQIVVDRSGVVEEIEVLSAPTPDLGFTAAAREAVRQWRYRPGRQGRMPVAVFVTVSMDFTID